MINRRGSIYIPVLIVTTLFVSFGISATAFVISQTKLANQKIYKQMAFQIAEAGTEYYRWHLAHAQSDYQDGTSAPGPYVHAYTDTGGNPIGQFSLAITPPPNGSTLVSIESSGNITSKPKLLSTLLVKMGIPSFTTYAVAANDVMRFGEGTEVYGPIHSNNGIRFDGIAHNLVSSHAITYDDPDHTGSNEYGVHTHVNAPPGSGVNSTFRPLEAPPNPLASRPDVFIAGRVTDAPTIDFNSITSDLATIQTAATPPDGIYLGPSGGQGYHITLRADGKVDLRIVNAQLRCQYQSSSTWRDIGYCSNNFNRICYQNVGGSGVGCNYCSGNITRACTSNSTCSFYGEGTCITTVATCVISSHSIGTRVSDQSTFTYQGASSLGVTLPPTGIIFAEDDLWVDGAINNARVTVVAARQPLATGNANIYLTNDLTYTPIGDSSGSDAIGLIAQNNILVGYFSENDLRIDAALIAQKGRIGRPYYGISASTWRLFPLGSLNPDGGNTCNQYRMRTLITSRGALGTFLRYGFAWVGSMFDCGGGQTNASGYCTRNLIYDDNFYFAPPPYFPTTGQYRIISWEAE